MLRKNIIYIILTLLIWAIGIIGVLFALTHSIFDNMALPLWSIYTVITIYVICAIIVTVITIRKIHKAKNRYRKYYDI